MIPNYNRSIPSQGKTASVAAGLAAVIQKHWEQYQKSTTGKALSRGCGR
jgi:hypothetical protein